MFTGLIEALGTVRELKRQGGGGQLVIASTMAQSDLQLGESIAVNGACLTVTSWTTDHFVVDVSPETFERTTLGTLRQSQQVNLERALRLSDRLGGHLVSGHIDCVATLRRRYQDQNSVRMQFEAEAQALRYIVEKGSVAIDGISLTVNHVDEDSFSVAIIPHSLDRTTLKNCSEGVKVNIETDMIGRYVERFVSGESNRDPKSQLNMDFLAKNGFL
jgi:riboflavin synthase